MSRSTPLAGTHILSMGVGKFPAPANKYGGRQELSCFFLKPEDILSDMDYRNENHAPLDRADEAFLRQILEENAAEERFGEIGSLPRPHPRPMAKCGCLSPVDPRGRRDRERHPSPSPTYPANRGEENRNTACGCNRNSRQCGDDKNSRVRRGAPLAMVYAPDQEWDSVFEPEAALLEGSLFQKLIFPWYPSACRGNNSCGCKEDFR